MALNEAPKADNKPVSITDLVKRLNELETTVTSLAAVEDAITALNSSLSALSSSLSDHKIDTSTHGVTEIIGSQEPQALDSKQIGQGTPGKGAFTQLKAKTLIDEDMTIASDECSVLAGDVSVTAELTVDGSMVIL